MQHMHTAIPVKNIDASQRFYEHLGFSAVTTWEKPQQALRAVRMQDTRGAEIELVYHSSNEQLILPIRTEVLHLGIPVDNLEERLTQLQKLGAKIRVPITKGVTVRRFAFLEDPNGFSVELFEP